jgi:YesN/AraC family two-component response regulator
MQMTKTESPQKKLRVLIADDIQETRRNTRLMLSMNENVEVAAIASNGRQAVDLAKEHHPDIVILDINMPELDGLRAYKEISEIYPDTGCIIISAQKDEAIVQTARAVGAQEYLVKPFTIDEMNAAVNRVAERVEAGRKRLRQAGQLHKKSEAYLKQLAEEYSKARRTDNQALDVFEQLAANPQCELRWLRTLAMLYIIRQEWGKLKALAERLQYQARTQKQA